MTQIAVFKTADFTANEADIHRVSECGSLAPVDLTDHPSMDGFIACKGVPEWPASETLDESYLPEETEAAYELRMTDEVNAILGRLNIPSIDAAIMSVARFVTARGQ